MNEMNTYQMRSDYDCGPSAVAFALGVNYDQVTNLWGWKDRNSFRDNLLDSPWHHFAVLEKMRVPWQIVTCGMILRGEATPHRTVVLLHSVSNPLLNQHWVVFAGVTSTHVLVHWGDGTIKRFLPADFEKAYSKGTPACAYEVFKGSVGLKWYQRLWVKLTGKFI